MKCKRCGKHPAEGFFDDDGLWVDDLDTQEPESYCRGCADFLMAMASEWASEQAEEQAADDPVIMATAKTMKFIFREIL